MSAPKPYPWRVMISSVMDGVKAERATIARLIKQAHLTPWYAERPPEEFAGESPETISFSMAARCDLYLLIIFSRYGSQVYPEDIRAVTHQEYHHAREANPRKVRVFIAADALNHADSLALRAFIDEVTAFKSGYDVVLFNTSVDLETAVQDALERFLGEGHAGRDAYVQAVMNDYHRFLNPAIGKEMEYSATVQVKLRAQLTLNGERPKWDEQESENQAGTATGDKAEVPGGEPNRIPERERLRAITHTPAQVVSALLTQHQRLVALGDVGSGKTTLLKRLAHDTAEAFQRGRDTRLPILVTATKLGEMSRRYPGEPLAEIVGRVQEEETRTDALRPTIRSTITSALANGQALLIVDALDEADSIELTAAISLLTQIATNWAILASRPAAYRNQIAGWQVADLLPLSATQRRELVLQVFRLQRQSDGSPPSEDALANEVTHLEQALRKRRADLAAWAGNPLLLTLISVQFIRDHHLPESRARIYEFAIEDLQGQRPTTAHRYLTNSEVQRLLQTLSLQMQGMLRRRVTVAEVRDIYLRNELEEFSDRAIRTAVALEVLSRAGALQAEQPTGEHAGGAFSQHLASDQDAYAFVHLSFREYLAACAIASQPDGNRNDLARRHALHAEWEQVILLLVSHLDAIGRARDADKIIQTLIATDVRHLPALKGRDPTHLALRLATRCAASRGKRAHSAIWRTLGATWWRLWRAEERRYRDISEVALVNLTLNDGDDRHLMEALSARMLGAGLPLFLSRLDPQRQLPRSRWWVWSALLILIALCPLVLVAQITLSVPLFSASALGVGLSHSLPKVLLVVFSVFFALRLYGVGVRASVVRYAMFLQTFHRIDPSLVQGVEVTRTSQTLLPLLRDIDWRVRRVAAEALGQLGEAHAVEPLLPLLGDTNPSVRRAAADALGQPGDVGVIELLIMFLGDSEWRFRELAHGRARRMAAEALVQLGDAAVKPLLSRVDDANSSVRVAITQALGQLGDVRAVEPLLPLLGDGDAEVRQSAAEALGRLGDARAVEPLLTLLNDANSSMRRVAAEALGRLGEAAVQPLLSLLGNDRDAGVRRVAAEALGRLGDACATEPLIAFLGDEDWRVRRAVVQALGQLGDARTLLLMVRRLQIRHQKWVQFLLAALHAITNWLVLVGILLAQITFLAPAARAIIPAAVTRLLGLTAWWQVILIALLCVGGNLGVWFKRRAIMYESQDNRDVWLNAAEQLIRRHVIDTRATAHSNQQEGGTA